MMLHGMAARDTLRVVGETSMVATSGRLVVESVDRIQIIDVTERVRAVVRVVGLRDGIVTAYSMHTTAAVRIQEAEPLLLEDLKEFLERVAPRESYYRHNDFEIRTQHMHPDESPNGSSHCQHLLLGSSETIPVVDGELQLGEWQRVFVIELDGPRPEREVLIQVVGAR